MTSLSFITEDLIRQLCGRKNVANRRAALERLVSRAYRGEPRHNIYKNHITLQTRWLESVFGRRGAQAILKRFFYTTEKTRKYKAGAGTRGYGLKLQTTKQITKSIQELDVTSKAPYQPKPIIVDGLTFPSQLPVNLANLLAMTDAVEAAMRNDRVPTYPWQSLGSEQSLEKTHRQLLAVRATVLNEGALPNMLVKQSHGRWGGEHDQHPIRLPRPTRYLTFGDRDDWWDVDLSNAHLVIALGLAKADPWVTRSFPRLESFCTSKDVWAWHLSKHVLDQYGERLSKSEAGGLARRWLYGAWKKNKSHPIHDLLFEAPHLVQVIESLPIWSELREEVQYIAQVLSKSGKELSQLVTPWETSIMKTVGRHLNNRRDTLLISWLFDGFFLLQNSTNPSAALKETLQIAREELNATGKINLPDLGDMKPVQLSSLGEHYRRALVV